MALKERITSTDKIRSWTDQIPFHYEYTAGVAGERFLRGLQEGKVLASECVSCGKLQLPPKAYCVDCFAQTKRYRRVGPEGTVAALTRSSVGFEGERLPRPQAFVYVTFEGVVGGVVHRALGDGVEIGSKVAPRFKAQGKRTGSMLDIEGFAKA